MQALRRTCPRGSLFDSPQRSLFYLPPPRVHLTRESPESPRLVADGRRLARQEVPPCASALGLALLAVMGCGSDDPTDKCDERAFGECVHLAERCGLLPSDDLSDCGPFTRCDDTAFADCMSEHGR